MIKNYIKIAWRSILKNKLFSLLNIIGLSVSLCICILLLAYTNRELSFDLMYPKVAEIYRVNMKTTQEYNYKEWVTIPNAVGPAIKKDVPGVIASTRLLRDDFGSPASIMVNQQTFIESGIYLADSSIFSMFDIKFVEGNSNTVFKEKNSIVISQSKKEKLFGSKSAINELIYINQRDTLQITGVFEDLPQHSTLDCKMIYNIMDTRLGKNEYWGNASYETYLQLNNSVDPKIVENNATKLIDKYVEKEDQYFSEFSLQPLKEVHLYSADFREGYTSRIGSIGLVKNLLFLAALIALIASINYMNLATARTSRQTKEIGVNKILGASKTQVSTRFYIETFIITLISIAFGFILSLITIPLFNAITGIEILMHELVTIQMAITLVCCWIVISVLAGSFPALYMASIKSLNLIGKGHGKSILIEPARKCLVVFQFSASIMLAVAVIVMLLQVNYMKKQDLGYQPDGLLSINIKSIKSPEKLETLLNNINQINSTIATTSMQALPGIGESGKEMYKFNTSSKGLPIFSNVAGGPVVKSLGLKLLAGSDLPKNLSKTDTNSYILINEVALAYLGYQDPAEAIGKTIPTGVGMKSIIHGVVGNFNYKSLKENIGAYMFYRMNAPYESIRFLMIRFAQGNTAAFLNQVKNIFQEYNADSAFDYTFIDNHVANQYQAETKTNHIIITFSILAICIASLGLLGLAAFTIEQRSKEIGIRKVLGANVSQITRLLSKGYLKLILIAFIIATPISWIGLNFWLNNFAYRIELPWWPFMLSGLIALTITILIISFQTIHAALSNPVNKLRDE